MGQSIISRLEWSDSTIVTNIHNENFLSDIIRYVQLLAEKHKSDAETEFRRPLQYPTTLRPQNFEGSPDYIVHTSAQKYVPPNYP